MKMDLSLLILMLPALAAGLFVLLSHVSLGAEVLRRGIIFIDIALAQIVGLGIILASFLGFEAHGLALQLIALSSAFTAAFLLSWLEEKTGQYQEAMIGIIFVVSASGSLLLLAHNPHGGEQLQTLLNGQILWINWPQLVLPALVGLSVFGLQFFAPAILRGKAFYFLFAVAVTLSVQVVGVYLVFASLIIPAIAARDIRQPTASVLALLIGMTGYIAGLSLSALFDLPSGACIVWTLALSALIFIPVTRRFHQSAAPS